MEYTCGVCGVRIVAPPSADRKTCGRECNRIYQHRIKAVSVEDRFLARLAPPNERGCIEWTGGGVKGYGMLSAGHRRRKLTHILAWERAYGPVPAGLCVLHRCDNPPCCNPEHLFLGTRADNIADMKAKGRARGKLQQGTRNSMAKLDDAAVAAIRTAYATGGETQDALAARYGVSRRLIGMVVRGRVWAHVPGPLIDRRRYNRSR